MVTERSVSKCQVVDPIHHRTAVARQVAIPRRGRPFLRLATFCLGFQLTDTAGFECRLVSPRAFLVRGDCFRIFFSTPITPNNNRYPLRPVHLHLFPQHPKRNVQNGGRCEKRDSQELSLSRVHAFTPPFPSPASDAAVGGSNQANTTSRRSRLAAQGYSLFSTGGITWLREPWWPFSGSPPLSSVHLWRTLSFPIRVFSFAGVQVTADQATQKSAKRSVWSRRWTRRQNTRSAGVRWNWNDRSTRKTQPGDAKIEKRPRRHLTN